MKRKFLLGFLASLAVIPASAQADAVMTAGASLGYRQSQVKNSQVTEIPLAGNLEQEQVIRGIKYLTVTGYFDALINEHFYLSLQGKYGFGLGKAKGKMETTGGFTRQDRSNHRGHLGELSALFGYRFNLGDSFALTPVVGYEIQRTSLPSFSEKNAQGVANTLSKIKHRSPIVGLQLQGTITEELMLNANFSYLWPKTRAFDKGGPNFSERRLFNKTGKGFRIELGTDYQLNQNLALNGGVLYEQTKAKGSTTSSIGDKVKSSVKQKSWEFNLGTTYSF